MWILALSVVAAMLIIYCTHIIISWRSSRDFGVLPPGSMGLPFIGETLQMVIPSYSLDLHPFIKKRIQRYGPIFRTRVLGRSVVMSADPDFNNYIVQQEGKSVGIWIGPLSVFITEGNEAQILGSDFLHRYVRSITLSHMGAESIRHKLLPQLEDNIGQVLHNWSNQESVELKQATSMMNFHFFAKYLFGYDAEKLSEASRIAEKLFSGFSDGTLSLPFNIPGTRYHEFLKEAKKAFTTIKSTLEERRASPNHQGDFFDEAISDIGTKNILTEDTVSSFTLGITFASVVSTSSIMTLMFKFLSEYPSVEKELIVEHEEILNRRNKSSYSLTWDEYKSMNFTQQVINEALRFSVLLPALFRVALEDIQVKEYTIPAGWIIMAVTPALHMDPKIFEDPVTFNPWRWKDIDSYTVSKFFRPFGMGTRQCPGAELARAYVATFLHVLVTKYRWKKIKGGDVVRTPILAFRDGFHIKVWKEG
ncbi:hypothetical protein L6164_031021 [Bauhinia variegata]|uniref:Uncharacterized protein n=1 Tax=Bauhinia variegata TaxID=167791 RepID=A0ACB9LDR8_BAUVA|nr:hypothetical protein L6164_031021 [Bauhinia variegata]